MASAVARVYNGGSGGRPAEPPAGSRGRALVSGTGERSAPKAEALLVFRRSMEAANLPIFLKFGYANKSDV